MLQTILQANCPASVKIVTIFRQSVFSPDPHAHIDARIDATGQPDTLAVPSERTPQGDATALGSSVKLSLPRCPWLGINNGMDRAPLYPLVSADFTQTRQERRRAHGNYYHCWS